MATTDVPLEGVVNDVTFLPAGPGGLVQLTLQSTTRVVLTAALFAASGQVTCDGKAVSYPELLAWLAVTPCRVKLWGPGVTEPATRAEFAATKEGE